MRKVRRRQKCGHADARPILSRHGCFVEAHLRRAGASDAIVRRRGRALWHERRTGSAHLTRTQVTQLVERFGSWRKFVLSLVRGNRSCVVCQLRCAPLHHPRVPRCLTHLGAAFSYCVLCSSELGSTSLSPASACAACASHSRRCKSAQRCTTRLLTALLAARFELATRSFLQRHFLLSAKERDSLPTVTVHGATEVGLDFKADSVIKLALVRDATVSAAALC